MVEQSGKALQVKLDRLQERVSELEEQVQRADSERILVAQLVCRVEMLENKLAARACNEEEESRKQQEVEPGVASQVEQKQESEPGEGSREGMNSGMANPLLSQPEGEPRGPPQESIEQAKQAALAHGEGKDGTGDTEEAQEVQGVSSPGRKDRDEQTNTGPKPPTHEKGKASRGEAGHGERAVPPSQGCQVPRVRPPLTVSREVIVAGDGNVGRFAKDLVQKLGDDGSVEYLYRRGATVDQVHRSIGDYERQAREVPRIFVLHVGLKEALRGEADRFGAELEKAWAEKGSHLVVCSIPEITGRGRASQADVVLANERLQAICTKMGARFLDLAKVLGPGSFAAADGQYSDDGARHVAGAIADAVTPFLGRSDQSGTPRGSKKGGARKEPSLEALWEAVELLVRRHRKGRLQRKTGRAGSQEAVASGGAGGTEAA